MMLFGELSFVMLCLVVYLEGVCRTRTVSSNGFPVFQGCFLLLFCFLSSGFVETSYYSFMCRYDLITSYTHIPIDLWGRGYSDTPLSLPHDARLYSTAILIAITSSSIPWSRFSLVGYSLGGAIAVSFASYFPKLLDSLVLIAPGGLIRPHRFGRSGKFLYSTGLFPESLLEWMVKRRIYVEPSPTIEAPDNLEATIEQEAPKGGPFDRAVLSKRRPGVTVAHAVVSESEMANFESS